MNYVELDLTIWLASLLFLVAGVLVGYAMANSRHGRRHGRVIYKPGYEVVQSEEVMEFTITQGGKKPIRFKPLNKFGNESKWDLDNPLHVVSSEGPATAEVTELATLDEFMFKTNGQAGQSIFNFSGDGHNEGPGEPESVKEIAFTVVINAAAADVESVEAVEGVEVPE